MLLVRRPKTPERFNRSAQAARTKIRALVRAQERPKSADFEDIWSEFKHVLAEAQGHRCGYCDRHVLGGDDGTVDHFCPKAEITALHEDPATWGTQKAHSASVEGRQTQAVSTYGYHWLAYAWNNYVFACSCCNEKWKRAIFPVSTHPRCCPPRPRGHEEPLLLSCYGKLRPSEHLLFNADGTVEARSGSRYGYETIRTVGLYRDPLCNERKAVAEDAHDLVREFADGDEAALHRLRRMGAASRPFAGVVRAIAEQQFGMAWEEVLTL
ncbi:MAG: hypothetical protein QM820_01490 [Minicystis sp.]